MTYLKMICCIYVKILKNRSEGCIDHREIYTRKIGRGVQVLLQPFETSDQSVSPLKECTSIGGIIKSSDIIEDGRGELDQSAMLRLL